MGSLIAWEETVTFISGLPSDFSQRFQPQRIDRCRNVLAVYYRLLNKLTTIWVTVALMTHWDKGSCSHQDVDFVYTIKSFLSDKADRIFSRQCWHTSSPGMNMWLLYNPQDASHKGGPEFSLPTGVCCISIRLPKIRGNQMCDVLVHTGSIWVERGTLSEQV